MRGSIGTGEEAGRESEKESGRKKGREEEEGWSGVWRDEEK